MSSPAKLAIVDKLLPLLEAFGASRARQSECRREMKASACQHEERIQTVSDEEGDPVERYVPCYDSVLGRTPWCDACRRHDGAFSRLMQERAANKKRLHRIERLAVAFAAPEPAPEPERKELLELIHSLSEDDHAETTVAGE